MYEREPKSKKLVPGDLISIEFSPNPKLRHYGIVAKNTLYVYDFSKEENSSNKNNKKIIKIQKRTLKKFIGSGTDFQIEDIDIHGKRHRIITLERAEILTRIYKKNFTRDSGLPIFLERILHVIPSNSMDYNWLYRNCEHAATWCKIGEWDSKQIKYLSDPNKWIWFFFPKPKSVLYHLKESLSDFFSRIFGVNNQSKNYYADKNHLFIEYTFSHFLFRIKFLFNKGKLQEILKIDVIDNPMIVKECETLLEYDRRRAIWLLLIIVSLIIFLAILSIDKAKITHSSTLFTNPTIIQVNPSNNNKYCYYKVKNNDTLRIIAENFYSNEEKWKVIYSRNKLIIGNNPDNIKKGMLLVIPVDSNNRSYFRTQDCSTQKSEEPE